MTIIFLCRILEMMEEFCDLEWLHGLNNVRPGKALGVSCGFRNNMTL